MVKEEWVPFRVIGGDNHTPKSDQLDCEERNPLREKVLQLVGRQSQQPSSNLGFQLLSAKVRIKGMWSYC